MKWFVNDVSMDYVIIWSSSSRCCSCNHPTLQGKLIVVDVVDLWEFIGNTSQIKQFNLLSCWRISGWMHTHQHLTPNQTTHHFEYACNVRLYKGTFKIELCNIAWEPFLLQCDSVSPIHWCMIWGNQVSTCINTITWFSPLTKPSKPSTMTTSSFTVRNGACMKAGAWSVGWWSQLTSWVKWLHDIFQYHQVLFDERSDMLWIWYMLNGFQYSIWVSIRNRGW